jgi:two-component system response regulator RegA
MLHDIYCAAIAQYELQFSWRSSMASTEANGAAVLIIDNHDAFCLSLGRSFREIGFGAWLSSDLQQARAICDGSAPALIITELQVEGQWAFDFIPELRERASTCSVAIATVHPSVATAVRAVRMGFEGYFAKPVSASGMLDLIGDRAPLEVRDSRNWPSLDRTIWEYINQVFTDAGTMSEAARRLGLDRRSLRRMLAKFPPAR